MAAVVSARAQIGAGAPPLDQEMIARKAFMDKFDFFGSTDLLETILWQLDPELNPHYACKNGAIKLEKGQFPINLNKLMVDIKILFDQADEEPRKSLIIKKGCRKHILVMKKILIDLIKIYTDAKLENQIRYSGYRIFAVSLLPTQIFKFCNVIPSTKFTTIIASIPFHKQDPSLVQIVSAIKYNYVLATMPDMHIRLFKIHFHADPRASDTGRVAISSSAEEPSDAPMVVLNDHACDDVLKKTTALFIEIFKAIPPLEAFPPGILLLITDYIPKTGEGM